MTSWSTSRQLTYGAGFSLFLLLLIGIPSYFVFFNKAPSCYDGKQNQNEGGIDCGGVCAQVRACSQEVIAEPVILWSRAFNVSGGVYNLVAYLQNPNVNYVADPVEYSFVAKDKDNVIIGLREGVVSIPPVKTFPIFEQSFDLGEREPAFIEFKFNNQLVWKRYQSVMPELAVSEPSVKNPDTSPRIDASVINNTFNRYTDVEVIAIVYGADENAIATSRTFISVLPSRSQAPITFTWLKPFEGQVTRVEIIPKLPF